MSKNRRSASPAHRAAPATPSVSETQAEAMREIDRLKNDVEERERVGQSLRQELAGAHALIERLVNDFSTLQRDSEATRAELMGQIGSVTQDFATLEALHRRTMQERDDAVRQLNALIDHAAELERLQRERDQELSSAHRQIESVIGDFGTLEQRARELRDERDRANSEVSRVAGDFDSLEKLNRQLSQELGDLRKMNGTLLDRIQRLGIELRDEQRLNAAANHEISRITDDFGTLEKCSRDLRREIADFQKSFGYRLYRMGGQLRPALLFGGAVTRLLRFGNSEAGARRRLWFFRHLPMLFSEDPVFQLYRKTRKQFAACAPEADTGLRLPEDLPMTSVIITAAQNGLALRRCLRSLGENAPKAPYEVIVVDHGGSDSFRTFERDFPNVKCLHTEGETDAIEAANLGAEAAEGEFLAFLAEDALPLPGWLDELAAALHTHREAGAVGAQLIDFESGKIAESGCLICRNGWIVPLGRGKALLDPEFSCFREISAASDSAVILRRGDFKQAGMLDPACGTRCSAMFDLELKLRRDGRRHYVMPLARVLAHGATGGGASDDSRNRDKKLLLERWGSFIEQHELYSDPDEYRTRRRYPKPRVLFLDAETPMPDRGSGCLDAVYFLDYLIDRGYEVVFHAEYTPGYVKKYTAMLLRKGVQCVCLPETAIADYLTQYGSSFQYLFVSRVYQAQCFDRLLQSFCRGAVYIFDTVDLHFIREKREADLNGSAATMQQAYRTRQLELTFAGRADATIVISKTEKQLLEQEFGLERIWHIPQVRAAARHDCTPEGRSGAVFIGSAHRPNQDALQYFHDEILPLVLEKQPDFKLTIIGEALRDALKASEEYRPLLDCPQFDFVGFVEELGDVLDTARLTLAPLRYGAGTKGKVTSSMAYGVPCVSSPAGVEGTGMRDGIDLLVGADPEAFADAIERLTTDDDLWLRLSKGGLDFLRRNNDEKAISAVMDQLFADAARHKQQVEMTFQAICSAPQLVAFGHRLTPERSAEDDQRAMMNAILRLHPHRQASIYFMSPAPAVAACLQERWPNFTAGIAPCPPPESRHGLGAAFDVIAFHSCPSRSALNAVLEEAIHRLYHGGRIFFPCPKDPEMLNALFDDLHEAEYQVIFCVPDTPGNGCVCALKAIPRNEESQERW